MIDYRLLLNDYEETARRLRRKGTDEQLIEDVHSTLGLRRELTPQVDSLRAGINARSKQIGEFYRSGRGQEAAALKSEVEEFKSRLQAIEAKLQEASAKADDLLLRLPNLPDDDCPDGLDESCNVVLRTEGYDRAAYQDRKFAPHWETATALGIFDGERASKLSGSMFSLLRGGGARLNRALVQLALDLNQEHYEEVAPPHFVRSDVMVGTGHLPKFANDAYRISEDDLWAIPTGEVPLTGMHRDEILPPDTLPVRYMAYTVCFRREAGSAGKDTRGMQRLHEFHKVEMVRICAEEQVQQEFQAMLANAEKLLQLLELPYRVVDLCAGDLTFSSSRIFDLEVYAPGVDKWLEVSSVGIFGNFQARRSNMRFRRSSDSKPEHPHLLNGSAVATPRVWAALIEHGAQPDGTVRLPEVLHRYYGESAIRPR